MDIKSFPTAGKAVSCRAAVAWNVNEPLSIETITVDIPKAGEVRIRIHASGVCHSDLFFLRGGAGTEIFPCVLGHEGAGVVESVGPGVTSVVPGDHVIPLYTPQCYECDFCKSPDTNMCGSNAMLQMAGLMSDGTSRFTCKGKTILHNMGCSTFSEYTVVHEVNVSKINKDAALDKICLIGCGIPTGYGAALNTAKVRPGSSVAIWGLGGVGLAVAMGAAKAGAKQIIGIDINPAKSELSQRFGVTEFINPKDYAETTEEVIAKLTNGGVDYSFECTGNLQCMKSALDACHSGWGVCTLVGLAALTEEVSFSPFQIISGRTIKGTYFGGWKSRDHVPQLVEDYLSKSLMVDEFISHTVAIEEVGHIIELMKTGQCLRGVVKF